MSQKWGVFIKGVAIKNGRVQEIVVVCKVAVEGRGQISGCSQRNLQKIYTEV